LFISQRNDVHFSADRRSFWSRIYSFQAVIVQKKAFFQKFPQVFRSPLPELDAPGGAYPIADGQSDFQTIKFDLVILSVS
jgi:hypothetical protein